MADTPNDILSRSTEDYLKAIYLLTERTAAASTSALAEALGIQPASVTGMVKKLAESGLLEHAPYRGVRLTPEGGRQALRIIRRHRVLETYLVKRLDYSWDDVHEEAERLEHAASDDLINQMARALDHPTHDPHGAPIPSSSGEIADVHFMTLAEVDAGLEVEIRSVRDEDPEDLRQMEMLGLVPGTRVTVVRRMTTEGLTLSCDTPDGRGEVVAENLARRIFVAAVRE